MCYIVFASFWGEALKSRKGPEWGRRHQVSECLLVFPSWPSLLSADAFTK
jgi:hypothetical protein